MIDSEVQALERYRRALRREDQVYFDEIVSMAEKLVIGRDGEGMKVPKIQKHLVQDIEKDL